MPINEPATVDFVFKNTGRRSGSVSATYIFRGAIKEENVTISKTIPGNDTATASRQLTPIKLGDGSIERAMSDYFSESVKKLKVTPAQLDIGTSAQMPNGLEIGVLDIDAGENLVYESNGARKTEADYNTEHTLLAKISMSNTGNSSVRTPSMRSFSARFNSAEPNGWVSVGYDDKYIKPLKGEPYNPPKKLLPGESYSGLIEFSFADSINTDDGMISVKWGGAYPDYGARWV